MEQSSESNNVASIKCSWSTKFKKRNIPRYVHENRSYIQDLFEQTGQGGGIVRLFMDDTRDAEPYSHQTDLVTRFFKDTDLADLEIGSTRSPSESSCLLDDRKPDLYKNIDEDGGLCRKQQGPLSPQQLFLALRKPRYTSATTSSGTQDTRGNDELDPDAERRIVYITNANSWSTLAIVATASTNQAIALRGFIYKYLNLHALISVSIPAGAPRFALEMHLPFYAWRKGSQPNTDSREDGTGQTLRKVRCVPFLHGNSHENDHSSCEEHIYQTQLSFLVSGIDNWSWVGYCFVDTYHDGSDSDDAVQNYPSLDTSPDVFPMDPASGGNFPSSPPFWSPRVYFLQVLQHRLGMVKDEWSNIVSMIQLKTQSYTHGLSLSRQLQQLPETDQRLEKLERLYDWTHNTIRLLLDLTHTLSKTINAWSEFEEFEIGYFLDGHSDKDAQNVSSAILAARKQIKEMKVLMKALENQKILCDNIAKELELHLDLENNKSTWIQLQTGERVKGITILALLVSPPSLSAAMFSMGSESLPFNPTFSRFLITTIVVALIMSLILWFLRTRSRRNIGRTFRNDLESARYNIRPAFWSQRNMDIHSIRLPSEDGLVGGIELNNLRGTSPRLML